MVTSAGVMLRRRHPDLLAMDEGHLDPAREARPAPQGPPPGVAPLHARIDAEAARLAAVHGTRLRCRQGCTMCCVDGIAVAAVEAEHIRRHHAGLLAHGRPHAEGMCAFLDEAGACRIYAHRPYVCRTQGLPLRWTDLDAAGRPVELRDICPLNEAGPPLASLPQDQCWSIGWAETALARLQSEADGIDRLGFADDEADEDEVGPARGRVPLRTLFADPG